MHEWHRNKLPLNMYYTNMPPRSRNMFFGHFMSDHLSVSWLCNTRRMKKSQPSPFVNRNSKLIFHILEIRTFLRSWRQSTYEEKPWEIWMGLGELGMFLEGGRSPRSTTRPEYYRANLWSSRTWQALFGRDNGSWLLVFLKIVRIFLRCCCSLCAVNKPRR